MATCSHLIFISRRRSEGKDNSRAETTELATRGGYRYQTDPLPPPPPPPPPTTPPPPPPIPPNNKESPLNRKIQLLSLSIYEC